MQIFRPIFVNIVLQWAFLPAKSVSHFQGSHVNFINSPGLFHEKKNIFIMASFYTVWGGGGGGLGKNGQKKKKNMKIKINQ